MTPKSADARLRELKFLARVAREQPMTVTVAADDPDRLMILHLLRERYINDLASFAGVSGRATQNGVDFDGRLRARLYQDLDLLLSGRPIALRVNHRGLVRLSELQQALQTGRDREPFGILLGQRHVLPDLIIAVTSANSASPLSVAYLDANGFKAINDTLNHAAGDEALRTFMSVLAGIGEGRGEAYRNGGDELVMIMPSTTSEEALTTMRAFASQLHKEKMPGDLPLSVSCGVVTTDDATADPTEFLKKADEEQSRAKERSRVGAPRPSVIAAEGKELEVIPWRSR